MERVRSPELADRPPSHRARPRLSRPLRLAGFGSLGLLLLLTAGLLLLLPVRASLLEARAAMEAGRDRLLRGQTSSAQRAFGRAEAASLDARGTLANPLTRLVSFVPILGRTPDAVTLAAEAGILLARAGQSISGGVERVPGGIAGLAPDEAAIPLQPIRALLPPLGRARSLIAEAEDVLRDVRLSWTPVADAMRTLSAEVAGARTTVVAAESVARALPSFLGADAPKRYFFGAQNPAELRGTGGLIGSYSIITVDGGRISFGPFQDINPLPTVDPSEVEPPNPDYAELYGPYGAPGFWKNLNMTPDFPSAAVALERLYERVEGAPLDGTIAADPQAFSILLEVAGPAVIPRTGLELDAASVVPFVANEAYSRFPDPATRKLILGEVAGRVLDRFLSKGASSHPIAAARALIEAAGQGHLLLHATDPVVQEAFETAGVAGALEARPGDFVAVIVNNAGGNKLDFYAERTIRYEVLLRPVGTAEARLEAAFVNHAPSAGQPAYVIGPHPDVDAEAGEALMLVSTYCAPDCRLSGVRRDGVPTDAALHEELGHPLFLTGERVPSGGTRRLEYRWTVPDAWHGDEYGGTYRLSVKGQPTIRPTRLEVDIRIPLGMRVVWTSPGMRSSEGGATWSGEGGDLVTLEVEFARKLFGRL